MELTDRQTDFLDTVKLMTRQRKELRIFPPMPGEHEVAHRMMVSHEEVRAVARECAARGMVTIRRGLNYELYQIDGLYGHAK